MTDSVPVRLTRRWVEIVEPDRLWRFDAAFLTSGWTCIYGSGCRGIHPPQDPARADGCCSLGAGITDAEDFGVVSKSASELTADDWQFFRQAKRTNWWKRKPNGEIFTRVHRGGCIFLNRPDHPSGPGCALHAKALRDGVNPLHRKPNVCWQLPLRIDEGDRDGLRLTTVRRWERLDFGDDGKPLEWWCTSAYADGERKPSEQPVLRTMEPELRALCGDDVYERLVNALS